MKERELQTPTSLLQAFKSEICVTQEQHEARETALEMLPEMLADSPLTLENSVKLFSAYMLCSYGFTPRKHEIKRTVNRMVHGFIDAEGLGVRPYLPKREHGKPHVLVISSWLKSTHAVSRCYAKSLDGLRKRFQTTALVFTEMDAKGAEIFDRTLVAPATQAPLAHQLRQLLALITREICPDIILFADIAMHPFCIALSNMRIAPLQAMLLGHPASSYSDCIDYLICEDSYGRAIGDFTEHKALCPEYEYACTLPETPPINERLSERAKGITRILVPGVTPKLSYPFLAALGKIMRELDGQAEIELTTYGDPKIMPELANDIRTSVDIPNSLQSSLRIHPRMPYDQYIALADSCDMFVNPFIFGGSNTVVDCLSRGLPGVTYQGSEAFSNTGAIMIRRCGLPLTPTCARSEREYIALAIYMAINHQLRGNMSAMLRQLFSDPAKNCTLFANTAPGYCNALEKVWRER